MPKPSILIIEDLPTSRDELVEIAHDLNFGKVETAADFDEAVAKWEAERGFDALIVDLKLGDEDRAGWQFLTRTNITYDTKVIIYSGQFNPDELLQPFEAASRMNYLLLVKETDQDRLEEELREVVARFDRRQSDRIVTHGAADREIARKIAWVAAGSLPVLITGESGSGKEDIAQRIAKQINEVSDSGPVRAINCANLNEELLLTELFGHVRGAFTGALSHRLGFVLEVSGYGSIAPARNEEEGDSRRGASRSNQTYLEWLHLRPRADLRQHPSGEECYGPSRDEAEDGRARTPRPYRLPGDPPPGILILDEVAELTGRAQAALLRALDGYPVRPVGYEGPGFLPNLRVVACTNNLDKLKRDFRKDLLGRLDGWHIHVPSIRDNPTKAMMIVERVAADFSVSVLKSERGRLGGLAVSGDVRAAVEARLGDMSYGIRQLKSWAERACTIALMENRGELTGQHLERAWEHRIDWTDEAEDDLGQGGDDLAGLRRDADQLRAEIERRFRDAGVPLRDGWLGPEFHDGVRKLYSAGRADIVNGLNDLKNSLTQSPRSKHILLLALQMWDERQTTAEEGKKLATIRGWFRRPKDQRGRQRLRTDRSQLLG